MNGYDGRVATKGKEVSQMDLIGPLTLVLLDDETLVKSMELGYLTNVNASEAMTPPASCNALSRGIRLIVQKRAYLHVLFTTGRLVYLRFVIIDKISPPLLKILSNRRI